MGEGEGEGGELASPLVQMIVAIIISLREKCADSSPEKKPAPAGRKRRRYESDTSSDDPGVSPLKESGEFYNGKKCIPVLTRHKTMFTTEGMVKMLLNTTNDNVKCTEPPKHVQMNAVFLIDLRYIPVDDLRAKGLP